MFQLAVTAEKAALSCQHSCYYWWGLALLVPPASGELLHYWLQGILSLELRNPDENC